MNSVAARAASTGWLPTNEDEGSGGVAVGQRRHREEDHAADDDRGGAVRIDLLGGRAVHPVRHPGRQSRLPDSRQRRSGRRPQQSRGPARRGEEGKDRRLHRRDCAGRPDARWSSTSTPSRCRTPTRSTTASTPSAVTVLLNAGASATNINILQGDQSVFTRDISIGGNAYTEALQRELNLPYETADLLKRGQADRRRVVRRCAAGAAGGDRERDARDPEDVRLLQDHRRLGSDRPRSS